MTALLRESVGEVLREARMTQGRTLREVSDSARVSLGYLSEVERGRKEASSELLNAICAALQVPLSELLFDAGVRLARAERAEQERQAQRVGTVTRIDAGTKVVIPPIRALRESMASA